MGHRGALARVALCAFTTSHLSLCGVEGSGGGSGGGWLSLEGAMRRFAPPEAVEAADQIRATLKLISAERPVRRAPELLDLLLLRALDKNETAEEAEDDGGCEDVGDARFARFCWRHASSAYGYVQLKALGMLPGVFPTSVAHLSLARLDDLCVRGRCGEATEVFDASFKARPLYGGVSAPAFYAAYCPTRHAVVCAVRGTADVGDALTDLVCEVEPVWIPKLQPDFNVRVLERFGPSSLVVLRELDESNRFAQKSAESTSI